MLAGYSVHWWNVLSLTLNKNFYFDLPISGQPFHFISLESNCKPLFFWCFKSIKWEHLPEMGEQNFQGFQFVG